MSIDHRFAPSAQTAVPGLTLVSHHLCPYVQRAAIALAEKGGEFERVTIDLADKPDWFVKMSPLGKVPLLKVTRAGHDDAIIFESAVILEYLEETEGSPLHPQDPLERARHRSWIEYGSAILNNIARFYSARDGGELENCAHTLAGMFQRLEEAFGGGDWFGGDRFSLVDAVYAPVFRYFDVFDEIADFGILAGKPKLAEWRRHLAQRPSVRNAVSKDYPARLELFLRNRNSEISRRINARAA